MNAAYARQLHKVFEGVHQLHMPLPTMLHDLKLQINALNIFGRSFA